MSEYVRRPIKVTAIQWDGTGSSAQDIAIMLHLTFERWVILESGILELVITNTKPLIIEEGQYVVLSPAGKIKVKTKEYIEQNYKPIIRYERESQGGDVTRKTENGGNDE